MSVNTHTHTHIVLTSLLRSKNDIVINERNDEKKHFRCKMTGENILCRVSMCLHGSGLTRTYYVYVHVYMHIHRRRETWEARKRDARKHAVRYTWRMRKREAAAKVECVLYVQNVFSIALQIVPKHAVGCIWHA